MTEVTTRPRILETPPRTTGDSSQDLPLLIDWFWKAYQIIVQAVNYVTAQQADIEENAASVTETQSRVTDIETILSRLISGSVTVSDTNNAFTVTFSEELPDNDYVVFAQAADSSGAAAAESFIVAAKSYSTTGFTVTLLSDPGAGTSVTYDWQLIKNDVG